MATSTTKLGLIKPDFVDVVDITDLNSNADDIDAAVGFSIVTSSTRPASPYTGQSIFETDTGDSFIWDGAAWQPGGGGGSIEISATAPGSPAAGDLWWDSDNGNLYIYYDDGDSQQWVAANGPQVFVGTTAPAGYQGQLWFDSTTGKVYIYYDDGSSAQWVSAIGGSIAGSVIAVKHAVFTGTQTASLTAGANIAVTDLSITHEVANPANKLIITVFMGAVGNDGGNGNQGVAVHDGTGFIAIGDAAGSRSRITAGGRITSGTLNEVVANPSFTIVHTPGSGSKTYTVRVLNNATITQVHYINRSALDADNLFNVRAVSSLVIQEVAG
jgi:hypothetical protein